MNANVAARYAKALLGITQQKGIHTEALSQLNDISHSLTDPQLKEFFNSPIVTPTQKVSALKAALENKTMIEEVVNAVLLMAERGRLSGLNEFIHAFQDGLDEESGITRGVVRAAKPLNRDSQAELEKKITQVLKKKIVLTFKEDPTLLGGVVAQVGGWTFDDSIETHLKKLNEELNRGAY